MSDDSMNQDEFTRATFFSSDADFAAAKAETPPATSRRRRRDPTRQARAVFTRVLAAATPKERRAALRWLAARFHVTLLDDTSPV